MFTLIIFGVLAILVIIAVSTFKTGRNSRLPEEVKMQRYQAKEAAKANTGGAILMVVGLFFAACVILPIVHAIIMAISGLTTN